MASDVILHDDRVEVRGTLTATTVKGGQFNLSGSQASLGRSGGSNGTVSVHARSRFGTHIFGGRLKTGDIQVGQSEVEEESVTGANGRIRMFAQREAGMTIDLNGQNGVATAKEFRRRSDVRSKEEVEPLHGSALQRIIAIKAVSFRWKGDVASPAGQPQRQVGFLAHEVAEVLPEAVSADECGLLAISYDSVVAVLSDAIREQQQLIEALNSRIGALEAEHG